MPVVRLFPNAVKEAKKLMARAVSAGDICIDATCGNGHDTVFLAQLVGETGKVYAFDIQQEALACTRSRLAAENLARRVELIEAGHEELLAYVHEEVSGVMFNLGYLPGGDKEVITQPETTVRALEAARSLLRPLGLITVVIYTGHPGGREEAAAVEQWAAGLPQGGWDVARLTFPNRQHHPPYLLAIQRREVD